MLDDLKRDVCAANLALNDAGLVLLTWGNVSGFDPDSGLVAIKPSGVSYAAMQPEQMVLVDLDGRVVEGDLRPSSDTPTHVCLYRAFPGLRGVAHTHSTYGTAWAQARRALPCYGTTHADNFRGTIPVTDDLTPEEVAAGYERETGNVIVRAFSHGLSPLEVPGVLVAGHAPFTWGHSPAHAVENSIVLEQCARMALFTEQVNPAAVPLPLHLQDKHFLRKHGAGAYYGQSGYRQ